MTAQFTVTAVKGLPHIGPGDDLAEALITGLRAQGLELVNRDILVVAQKIVSKAEGRQRRLGEITPSLQARKLAAETDKDARHVEAILSESTEVVRHKPGVIVVEHRLGHVMANAGIDQSNVGGQGDDETILLLPEDPDASAARLKARFDEEFDADIGMLIADSVGRAWRLGTVGLAVGAAGLPVLQDQRGESDLFGRTLEVSITGFADEVAAAATLVMGEAAEGTPAAVVSGLEWQGQPAPIRDILRPRNEDMFR